MILHSGYLRAACAALACVAIGSVGCVDIIKTPIRTEENVLARQPKLVPSPRFAADVQVTNNILRIVVTPQCSIVEEETVERVDIADDTVDGDSRAWMTVLSVAGSFPLMGGTAMIADSPNVHDSDLNSRLYNETGQEVVIGLGAALVGVGLACVLPPMVNALRAVGTSETRTTSQRQGAIIEERAPCKGLVTLPTYAVVARFTTGHAVPLGGAMPNDQFDVDLRATLGPTILGMSPPPDKVAIWINEKFQTEIPTSSIVEAARTERDNQDDAAWKAAEASACEASAQSCSGVSGYLSRFPNGRHAAEARKLLQPRTNVVAGDGKQSKLNQAVEGAAKALDVERKKQNDETTKALQKEREKAAKEAKKACEKECARICEKDKGCQNQCIVQVCP